jgi:hypothetical protein
MYNFKRIYYTTHHNTVATGYLLTRGLTREEVFEQDELRRVYHAERLP